VAIVLVGGGARSGKSRFALELARQRGGRLAFVATAEAYEPEMQARAAHHREERGDAFTTFEVPIEVAATLARECPPFDAVVVDCLTLWASNLLLGSKDVAAATDGLIEAARAAPGTVIFVTNEVGCGIVPENALARRFRDVAGRMNQEVAEAAAEVYWMVFGCALKVKG
jgi:adenosylcobinamide kinase / adenosylcobinamide-phosphate guanylyltransferase